MKGNIQLKDTKFQYCTSCNGKLKSLGKIPFRIEQTPKMMELCYKSAPDHFKEALCVIDVYRCESCGKLEMFDMDFSLPE